MKEFLLYQLEVVICMAAFSTIYMLFWRKETHITAKRFVLLMIPTFALIIPLLHVDINLHKEITYEPLQYIVYFPSQIQLAEFSSPKVSGALSGWEIGIWIYALGATLMLLRLVISYLKIWQVYRQSKLASSQDFRIVNDPIQSFSFFQIVIINSSQARSSELPYILAHEKAHSKQGHSFDILWLEIVKMFHWFNPFAWFLAAESRRNMEFLADREVICASQNHVMYQHAIVHHASHGSALLKSQFSKSNLKNRIIMMNQPTNQKVRTYKLLAALPVLVVLLMSFSLKIDNLDLSGKLRQTFPELEPLISNSTDFGTIIDNITSTVNDENSWPGLESSQSEIQNGQKKEVIEPITSKIRSQTINVLQDSGEISSGKAFPIYKANPGVLDRYVFNSALRSGKATPVHLLPQQIVFDKRVRLSLGMELSDVEQISGTVKSSSGEPIPGANIIIKDYTIGTVTDLSGEFLLKFEPRHKEIVISMVGYKTKALAIVAGKNYKIVLEKDPDAKKEMKRPVAIGYLHSKEGKATADPKKKPLYIIDGKVIGDFDESVINPQDIESISVLKDSSAVAQYGEKAKNGVVIIRTKGYSESGGSFIINDLGNEVENSVKIDISKSFDEDNPPLIILDGKEISHKKLSKVKTDEIESIEVLKGESALEKYGEKGKNGVIVIKMLD